ncbi:transcriptional regulator, XRE family [Xylanimonas cellulosilytica DSM 15894]|uniref:Transcriptional regulator, XRE family n=1 Tax=Xylanimonas cellulosilytica (strain DSM 15894 / JCM 12276 / CECT 5975 / KCTC 9989 / LMG 20990 / NBRC 107835 / XIL07) TaxID=446471 RepID=D1BS65_XYLCX|nr:helix-turn-helix domain-containing protein [Xylanimonas cellulosilytica]ACZ30557.1 transcriptional regulator, XRE family [Xylanimonas cellulosilytica DSM 15894]
MINIRHARERAGLSQAELARRAGIAPSNLSAIESGTRPASAAMVNRLLDAMGRPSVALREHRDEVMATIERLGGSDPRVFGSVARGEDGPGSDIDLLVRAVPGRTWDFVTLPRVLSDLLGVQVDVIAESGLRPTDGAILAEAVPL